MSVRIASFNVENLMERFDFAALRRGEIKIGSNTRGRTPSQASMIAHEDDARQMTALAIADCHADIVCLQEVENLTALEAFEADHLEPLTGLTYPNKVWIEGNDSRGIDVALMAREKTANGEAIEIIASKSHHKHTFGDLGVHTKALADLGFEPKERIFRRDCLEIDLRIGGKRMTLFVCHFKSMGGGRKGVDGRLYTMPVRLAEARAVRRIVEQKFGTERTPRMRWMICGDLNDYTERLAIIGNRRNGYRFELKQENTSGLQPLFQDGFCVDLVKRRQGEDRWTLYYAAGPSRDARNPDQRDVHHLVQLDYMLASPALSGSNENALPHIIREGQPLRAVFPPDQDVDRYPRTGWDRPKASDHCPVAVTLKMV